MVFFLFLSENQNLVKKLAWVCIADKWQIGCGPKNDYFTTKHMVPGTCYKWVNQVSQCDLGIVTWLSWGLFIPGRTNHRVAEPEHCKPDSLSSPCHPILTSCQHALCLVLLEFVFAGLNRGYVNTSKLFCKGDSRFDKLGSCIYCFSALFFFFINHIVFFLPTEWIINYILKFIL